MSVYTVWTPCYPTETFFLGDPINAAADYFLRHHHANDDAEQIVHVRCGNDQDYVFLIKRKGDKLHFRQQVIPPKDELLHAACEAYLKHYPTALPAEKWDELAQSARQTAMDNFRAHNPDFGALKAAVDAIKGASPLFNVDPHITAFAQRMDFDLGEEHSVYREEDDEEALWSWLSVAFGDLAKAVLEGDGDTTEFAAELAILAMRLAVVDGNLQPAQNTPGSYLQRSAVQEKKNAEKYRATIQRALHGDYTDLDLQQPGGTEAEVIAAWRDRASEAECELEALKSKVWQLFEDSEERSIMDHATIKRILKGDTAPCSQAA